MVQLQIASSGVSLDDNETLDNSEYDLMVPVVTPSTATNFVEEWRQVIQQNNSEDNTSGLSKVMTHSSGPKSLHAMEIQRKPPSQISDHSSIEDSSFGSVSDSILSAVESKPNLNMPPSTLDHIRKQLRKVQLLLWQYRLAIIAMFFSIIILRYATPSICSSSWACRMPGVRNLEFCSQAYLQRSTATKQPETRGNGEYIQKLLKIQSATFETAFNVSNGASEMSLELFGAQMALSDLAIVVHYSDLPRKREVGILLDKIANSTRRASEELKKYVWEANKATDAICAATEEARYRIDKAMTLEENYTSRVMNIITLQFRRTSHEVIGYSYKFVMSALETQLQRLRYFGELVSYDLAAVDRDLSALYHLIVSETRSISVSQEDLLATLWTLLGGNKVTIRKFDENLNLLKRLKARRNEAAAQVGAALYMLETESQELESLRSTILYPALVGEDVSMEMHLRLVNMALDRMADSHFKAPERYGEVYESLLDGNKPEISE